MLLDSSIEDSDSGRDRPEAPLLFLSSRFDPVTPLSSAYAMSARHPGSSVMVQESAGHTALHSAQSNCTKLVVQKYFETGEVPMMGKICEASGKPFSNSYGMDLAEPWISINGGQGSQGLRWPTLSGIEFTNGM